MSEAKLISVDVTNVVGNTLLQATPELVVFTAFDQEADRGRAPRTASLQTTHARKVNRSNEPFRCSPFIL